MSNMQEENQYDVTRPTYL